MGGKQIIAQVYENAPKLHLNCLFIHLNPEINESKLCKSSWVRKWLAEAQILHKYTHYPVFAGAGCFLKIHEKEKFCSPSDNPQLLIFQPFCESSWDSRTGIKPRVDSGSWQKPVQVLLLLCGAWGVNGMIQTSGKCLYPSRSSTLGIDLFSCKRKDLGLNPAELWSRRSSLWCQRSCVTILMSEGASSRDKKSFSLFYWTITLSNLMIYINSAFEGRQWGGLALLSHLKWSFSACPLSRSAKTSGSACSVEPEEEFPAFSAAGWSPKDATTLLGCDAGVSALHGGDDIVIYCCGGQPQTQRRI